VFGAVDLAARSVQILFEIAPLASVEAAAASPIHPFFGANRRFVAGESISFASGHFSAAHALPDALRLTMLARVDAGTMPLRGRLRGGRQKCTSDHAGRDVSHNHVAFPPATD
jgi:hypothetical protein